MWVDDVVKFIKGFKGIKVILIVKWVDGIIEEEIIICDVVEFEEIYVKLSFIEREDKKYGFINFLVFYFDMKDYGECNFVIDVKKEIESLKVEGMEGLVLDFCDNGGGLLWIVVDIVGLFIKEGFVV